VVDDSPQFRDVAAVLLAERGLTLLGQAADANQALHAATEACPDGILLDIGLPEADGFAAATSLAALCPGVRIVLTSATFTGVPEQLLRECAAIAFVPKDELAGADLGALFTPGGT
jgi:DNA-binding NarL/FixJ family response regulator